MVELLVSRAEVVAASGGFVGEQLLRHAESEGYLCVLASNVAPRLPERGAPRLIYPLDEACVAVAASLVTRNSVLPFTVAVPLCRLVAGHLLDLAAGATEPAGRRVEWRSWRGEEDPDLTVQANLLLPDERDNIEAGEVIMVMLVDSLAPMLRSLHHKVMGRAL